MIVKQHERAKPYEKRKARMSEQLWNEYVGNVLAMELESVLPEMLPDYGRDDIERLEQTY